jgi:hypothetical protein
LLWFGASVIFFTVDGNINSDNNQSAGEVEVLGKNRNKGINSDQVKEKTQELEETKRIPMGFFKNNPKKSK